MYTWKFKSTFNKNIDKFFNNWKFISAFIENIDQFFYTWKIRSEFNENTDLYLGCVCFIGKLKSENTLHLGPCLVPLENTIKLKIKFSLIIKYTSQAVNSFQDSFYLQLVSIIFHSSHTPQTVWIPLQAHLNSTPCTNEREKELHPTFRRAASSFSPLRQWVFSLFFSYLTQPHLHPPRALHVPDP